MAHMRRWRRRLVAVGVVVLAGCAGAVAVVEPEEGEEAVLVARVDTVWADTVGR